MNRLETPRVLSAKKRRQMKGIRPRSMSKLKKSPPKINNHLDSLKLISVKRSPKKGQVELPLEVAFDQVSNLLPINSSKRLRSDMIALNESRVLDFSIQMNFVESKASLLEETNNKKSSAHRSHRSRNNSAMFLNMGSVASMSIMPECQEQTGKNPNKPRRYNDFSDGVYLSPSRRKSHVISKSAFNKFKIERPNMKKSSLASSFKYNKNSKNNHNQTTAYDMSSTDRQKSSERFRSAAGSNFQRMSQRIQKKALEKQLSISRSALTPNSNDSTKKQPARACHRRDTRQSKFYQESQLRLAAKNNCKSTTKFTNSIKNRRPDDMPNDFLGRIKKYKRRTVISLLKANPDRKYAPKNIREALTRRRITTCTNSVKEFKMLKPKFLTTATRAIRAAPENVKAFLELKENERNM